MKRPFFSFLFSGIFHFWDPTLSSTDGSWKMVVEFAKAREWNHMLLLSVNENEGGVISSSDLRKVFYHLSESSIISKVSQQTYQSIREEGLTTDLNLTDPIYRKQFICSWDASLLAYLQIAGEGGFFSSQQEWLILLPKNQTKNALKENLLHIPYYIDSEVIAVQYNFEEEKWQFFEIWKPGPGSESLENLIGYWSPSTGLNLKVLAHKYDRRKDMKGLYIRVATIETMPYESLLADKTMQNFDEGYVVDIWHTLQEQLNFSYSATNTLFGSLQKDGVTWNGMVGMLQSDESDVAAAPLSITRIRSFSIDFTIPIQIVSTRLYIRRPALEATWVLYSLPFTWDLWACVPSLVVFSAFWLWALNKISMYFEGNESDISPVEAFWAMFSALVQQSSALEPKPFSSKFMFVTGFMSNMILYTCYAAILVSILTTMKPQLPFRDFEDLRENRDWDVGVRTNTALADALALSPKGSPQRDAWDYNVLQNPVTNLPSSNDDALNKVLKGKYAFFANKEYIIYRLQKVLPLRDAVNIVDTGKDFLVRGIGFGVQQNSPYKNVFNHYLSKMTSGGHLDRLKRKWWPHISRDPDSGYPSPGFAEVFTVFLIFGIGFISSAAFLGMENYTKRKKMEVDEIKDYKNEQRKNSLEFISKFQ